MPPKRQVSTAAAEHTEPRRTRASSRAMSGHSTTATSTSSSTSPDTSSQVESSKGKTGARAASQSAASSKTSWTESTSQSPTSSDSSRARSAVTSSSVPVTRSGDTAPRSGDTAPRSGDTAPTSGDTVPNSRSPTSSVTSTGRSTQPVSTSTTEAQSGHTRQLGPSTRVTKLNTFRQILAESSSSNRSTNEAGNSTSSLASILSTAPSAGVPRSSQNAPVSVQSGNKRRAMTPEVVTSTLPRGVTLGDASIFGAYVNSNRAADPAVPRSSQDVADQQVSSQDANSTPPRGAEARITSRLLDEDDIFESDEDDYSVLPGANVSRSFNDFNATVDLTSPAQPVPVPVSRVSTPTFRLPSESLLQQQDDLDDDMSELTLISPPVTPPRYSGFLMTQRRNNLGDMTIDLTDSPMAAPVPSSHEQNSPDAIPAPSASQEQNSLETPPGSTSHIKCPVCLDDLPQIISTRRTLMSTVCGHVFCSSCLPLCISSNGRCPSCRKALRPNQVHPIFL